MENERAAKINKYETWAHLVKMMRPDIKQSIEEIAADLYMADEERKLNQANRMKRTIRQSRDIQRVLDFGR